MMSAFSRTISSCVMRRDKSPDAGPWSSRVTILTGSPPTVEPCMAV
jgi:hypothetical protein